MILGDSHSVRLLFDLNRFKTLPLPPAFVETGVHVWLRLINALGFGAHTREGDAAHLHCAPC